MKGTTLLGRLLGLLVLLSATVLVSAQVTVQRTFGGPGNDHFAAIAVLPDTTMIVVGSTSSYVSGQAVRGTVSKIGPNGLPLWSTTLFGTYQYTWLEAVVPSGSNTLLAVGAEMFPYAGIVCCIDSSGVPLWCRTASGLFWVPCAAVMPGGDWLIAGESVDLNNEKDLYAYRIDGNGNTVWSFGFDTSVNERAFSIRPTSDGGAIIAGYIENVTGNEEPDGLLVKLDGTGSLEWSRIYATPGVEQFWDALPLSDGGYLVAGSHDPSPMNWNNLVARLDANGTMLWCNHYGPLPHGHARKAMETPDGFAVLMSGNVLGSNPALVFLDTAGAVTGAHWYGSSDLNAAGDLARLPDGRFAVVGDTWTEWSAGGYDGLVVLTHPDGSIDECGTQLVLDSVQPITLISGVEGVEIVPPPLYDRVVAVAPFTPQQEDHCAVALPSGTIESSALPAIKVHPVPTDGPLQVSGVPQGAQVSVYDAQGRTVEQFRSAGAGPIAFYLEGLPGLYLVRVLTADGVDVPVRVLKY